MRRCQLKRTGNLSLKNILNKVSLVKLKKVKHDFLTGKERQFGLDEFPTEDELIARFKQESGLSPAQEAIIDQPYYSSQNTYSPRYYQRIAINRTVDAIARGQNARCSSWLPVLVKPILRSKSFTVCCKAV